jgi:hypothetical protein
MDQPFLQDNARSHTNMKTTAGIRRFGITLLDHPTYRLNLVLSGFRLLCKPKGHRRRRHYASDVEVRAVVKLWFRYQNGQCYRDGLYEITWSLEKLFGPQYHYVGGKKVHKDD